MWLPTGLFFGYSFKDFVFSSFDAYARGDKSYSAQIAGVSFPRTFQLVVMIFPFFRGHTRKIATLQTLKLAVPRLPSNRCLP